MTNTNIDKAHAELNRRYPGCYVKVIVDQREVAAEVSDRFAVAVPESREPKVRLQ